MGLLAENRTHSLRPHPFFLRICHQSEYHTVNLSEWANLRSRSLSMGHWRNQIQIDLTGTSLNMYGLCWIWLLQDWLHIKQYETVGGTNDTQQSISEKNYTTISIMPELISKWKCMFSLEWRRQIFLNKAISIIVVSSCRNAISASYSQMTKVASDHDKDSKPIAAR